MVSVENITVEFGGSPLFDEISFLVNAKERIALVGKNGAGKTTLLRLIAGKQSPTRGRISLPKDLTIGYLPQTMIHATGTTVRQEAEKAFENIISLQTEIEKMTLELAERTDYESPDYHALIERHAHACEHLQMLGNGNFAAEIEKTLLGLGFLRTDFDRACEEFSGGWRMRIELAKILLQRPDLLLLDEPTNHLDIESIQWLETFLTTCGSAVLLVSHDRAFLDSVTSRTIEISLGKIYDYSVNYSKYVQLRKERREQQIRAYENQQKLIADTEDFIERFRYKATKAVQVQSRIKQLEKLERLEVDLEDTSRLNLKFPPAPHSGIIPVEIEHLSKSYGSHLVLDNVEMLINRGEKVAFVGKNGEGKSTLVKCIIAAVCHSREGGNLLEYQGIAGQAHNDELFFSGKLKLGHNVKIGYFAQNEASLLDENLTVFQTIDNVAVGDIRTKIRDILGAFMFGGEASDKKVKVLSGGERSRLAMIRLLLTPVNLLILDEPTNHLDMRSKDVLKEAIRAFDGTVIVVSHDRDFLDGLVTTVYEFTGKKARQHLGGIYDFLQHKKIETLAELEIKPVRFQKPNRFETENLDNKTYYEARKEFNRKLKKAEKELAESETQIAKVESELAEMNELLESPDNSSNPDFILQYQKKQRELEHRMYEWEILGEEVEKLKTETV